MTSLEVLVKVRNRLNKVDTQDDENLAVYSIIEAFNKAQLNVVNRLFNRNNNYKTGVESTKKRIDDLRVLINTNPINLNISKQDIYYVADLPKDYFHHIRIECLAKNESCQEKRLKVYLGEESNLNTLLTNEHLNPNFDWAETIATITEDNLKVFTLNKFEIKKVFLTYLRFPVNIDAPGYIKEDGSNSTQIDPELPDDIIEMCIDETTRIMSGDMHNQLSNQISQQNLQMNE